MAVVSTTTPMPPIKWVKLRQRSMLFGRLSISVRMEDPVVVKPDADSKTQSAKLPKLPQRAKGSAPKRDIIIQPSAAAAKPSLA